MKAATQIAQWIGRYFCRKQLTDLTFVSSYILNHGTGKGILLIGTATFGLGRKGSAKLCSNLLSKGCRSASTEAEFSGRRVITIYPTDASPKLSVEKPDQYSASHDIPVGWEWAPLPPSPSLQRACSPSLPPHSVNQSVGKATQHGHLSHILQRLGTLAL